MHMLVCKYTHTHTTGNAEGHTSLISKKNNHFFQINHLDNLHSLKETRQIHNLTVSLFTVLTPKACCLSNLFDRHFSSI